MPLARTVVFRRDFCIKTHFASLDDKHNRTFSGFTTRNSHGSLRPALKLQSGVGKVSASMVLCDFPL